MLVIGNKNQTKFGLPRVAALTGVETIISVDDTYAGQKTPQRVHRIRVPDFHTGHLGFIPDKVVLVSGPSNPRDRGLIDERTCELVVTPHPITSNILRVSCVFDERTGVVERIVNLMSHLNANIVTLESASLYQGDYHAVNLVVDMSQSWLSDRPLTGGERSKYIDILPNLRISNRRGLDLFLNIVWYCHEMLTWKDASAPTRQVPEVYVSEFEKSEFTPFGTSTVCIRRDTPPGARGQTYFELSHNKAMRIATLLGMRLDEPFHYILLSDTESRSLRIQFFQKEHADRIFQIGFLHKDEVGAMATIAKVVKKSNFNVLSGLIRNVDEYHNVWEVILEFKGPREALEKLESSDPRLAIQTLLKEAAEDKIERKRLAPYDVEVFIPSHAAIARLFPKQKGFTNSIPLLSKRSEDPLQVPQPEPLIAAEEWPETQDWLLDYAKLANSKRPRVFISCANLAGHLCDIVREELGSKNWDVTTYDEATRMEATYTEARRLVADADYLIGIWTPDGEGFEDWTSAPKKDAPWTASFSEKRPGTGGYGQAAAADQGKGSSAKLLSPWMHFELGQAVAFEREFKILAHDSLPAMDIVRRVAADRPVYWFKSEDDFRRAVKKLVSFMDLNWRPKHGPGEPHSGDKGNPPSSPSPSFRAPAP